MDKLATIITEHYITNNIITRDKQEIYSYGFKLIIADIINYTIIFVLGLIFNRLLESIVFLVSLCGIRQFTGGFHAKTFWLCRLSMIITYICVLCLSDMVMLMKYKVLTVCLLDAISIIFICIYAPIEHHNKPLSYKQKRNNKIKSIITSLLLSTISIICIVVNIKCGVTISLTLFAVIVLMIIAMAIKKGGEINV